MEEKKTQVKWYPSVVKEEEPIGHIHHTDHLPTTANCEESILDIDIHFVHSEVKKIINILRSLESNWNICIQCVKSISLFYSETKEFKIPSLALKIGHSMKKCAQDMYFKSQVKGNNEEANVADTFLKMYKIAWMVEISSKALATLEKIRYNKTQLLPLVEDVVTLSNYLKLISEKIKKSGICNQKQHVEFSKMCLAEIILFNRRRSGEEEL
ncbi:unnamed protein product [Mytilus edulis]|uniref:Uncharacterized protein n=1 Tax=Mytilus edulis TaxID=6550 RepID=A0A8S3S5Q7_MYTED|nr:unnamed protein product [Mytilus edulis]